MNITATDIVQPGFAAHFLELVKDSGFPADRLTVEVTEGGLIEDLAGAASLLANLRSGGLRIAIDDFGTGYSSLAYLKALPLDYLKIDKRLSQDIAGSTRDRIGVRSVIDLARSLGLDVIAEGVETEEQLALLAEAHPYHVSSAHPFRGRRPEPMSPIRPPAVFIMTPLQGRMRPNASGQLDGPRSPASARPFLR